VEVLRLMLERCRQCQISLNIKKCIFGTLFGILLGHIVCKQGLLVDPAKITVIVNLPPPKTVCQLRATLGHTGYYRKFIKGYAQITALMEKMLRKDTKFQWNDECQHGLDTLKEKMVIVDISISRLGEDIPRACRCISHSTWSYLGTTRSRRLGSPIAFARRNLSESDRTITLQREKA
jgi:hypothetical protein